MFIFDEGREAFNKVMTTILSQIIFGGIALLFLYKSAVLESSWNIVSFYIFTIFLWIALILWVAIAYIEFNNSYKCYLYPRVRGIKFVENIKNKTITIQEIWKRDRKLAFEYLLIQVLIIGILLFICIGSVISAVDIGEGANIR
ncbi:TPA: hypothetical protein N0X38_002582 [Acinetobacter baumannii]|jgi:hypothetical protein|uniref:hypothetical protein n=1 Tax=Acinetobacter TaxID=469 RepID=UPI0021C17ECB|nr:hypothetical protein [Acinetobacter baumannii]MCT9178079.1 hypothetical protein [Acinetobacter baumannii]MDA5807194.1 hypothetical protein [Acinetobacter baumannii]MDC4300210.1 hypothetical protein [Acinetobacter baumannii]MDC4754179.1 hypothetical protein [Acinetobacter baumannii]MDC5127045.1 hypothetical protein [Acinetobacter baumannii]